jgi:flagellar hook-associated protein 3 FlgL
MVAISMGDLAQTFMLRRQNLAMKQNLQRLSSEVTTGVSSDITARVSGDLGPISSIDTALSRLKAYGAVTTEAGLFASTMQTALDTIDTMSSDLSTNLLAASNGAADQRIDAVGKDGEQKLQAALSALNTQVGDRSLFAGVATNTAAVIDADSLLAALGVAVAGAVSAADVETAVTAWFASPTGYDAVAYQGGASLAAVAISPGEAAQIDVTAQDPAIRDTIKGLAMAALLNRGVLAGQPQGRQDLAQRAGLRLMENRTDRANLAARLGLTEAKIETAAVRNSNEVMSLQIARNGVVQADPYEAASKLEETQAQLEKIYAITARMSRLSLLDYLK